MIGKVTEFPIEERLDFLEETLDEMFLHIFCLDSWSYSLMVRCIESWDLFIAICKKRSKNWISQWNKGSNYYIWIVPVDVVDTSD